MGNAGKFVERARARELRAQSWTLQAIANELGVAKSSVSLWCRDIIDFTPNPRNRGHSSMKPHPMKVKRLAEIDRCRVEAEAWVGEMSDRDLTMFALGLYAGEGNKTPGTLGMANTNAVLLSVFATWVRQTFVIDEARLRVRLYLHEGLDVDAATQHWSRLLDVPTDQFQKPYRAVADPSRRSAKHVHGCATLIYASTNLHRRVLALIEEVSCRFVIPG
jgi:hypothetical protein